MMIDFEPTTLDASALRRAFGCFPSGVTTLCTLVNGTPTGLAASSFTSVSVEPPLVSVCLQNSSTTWPSLRAQPHLGVSVLAEDHHGVCRQLARKGVDRFDGVDWGSSASGSVFVHGASAWLDCTIYAELPAGDHTIVLLAIDALRIDPDTAPLVFHGSTFRKLAAL